MVQRLGEFDVRMALEASRSAIVRLVMDGCGAVVGVGLVLGACLPVGMVWVVRARLIGIDRLDPVTLVTVGVLVAAIAAAASLVPVWRAARARPIEALRYD